MKSYSEIETTTKRATKAIGFSWGVAEEVAKNIRLLELFGFKGIKNLNQYFADKANSSYESLTSIKKDNTSNKKSLCPIVLGVSFLDQIKTLELLNKCKFKDVAYPILFLPFLSRGSEIIGKRILFEFDKNQFLLNFNLNISSDLFDKEFPKIAKDLEITFLKNQDSFTDTEWKNIYKLSEETFVEETDSLKQSAAGAGLTDND